MTGDFSRNTATCDSPGQRPEVAAHRYSSALKGPDITPRCFTESAIREQVIKAKPRCWVMTGDLKPTPARCLSRNAASWDSLGQRPGYASTFHQALKGRPNRCFTPSGLRMFSTIEPRALPWAVSCCRVTANPGPIGAACESPGCNPGLPARIIPSALKGPDSTPRRFAESAQWVQAITANLRVLGYG